MADRDTGTQHKLRMPPELKERIAESAKAHNRSMNADIVARLEKSFETEFKVNKLREVRPNEIPSDVLGNLIEVLEVFRDVLDKKES